MWLRLLENLNRLKFGEGFVARSEELEVRYVHEDDRFGLREHWLLAIAFGNPLSCKLSSSPLHLYSDAPTPTRFNKSC